MISAGSKRNLGFDNDSLMWCHLALEMKNVKLALIIFHLFSEQIFLQEGNMCSLQDYFRGEVWSGSEQLLCNSTNSEGECKRLENEPPAPSACFVRCWMVGRRSTSLLFSPRAQQGSLVIGITTARWQGWSAVQTPALRGTAQLRAHTGAGTSLVPSWCWFRPPV